jgi:hypothetical protein
MMTNKRSVEKPFKIFAEPLGAIIPLKKKSALYWKISGLKTVLPNYADEKGLTATCITADRKSSWKPVRNDYFVLVHPLAYFRYSLIA